MEHSIITSTGKSISLEGLTSKKSLSEVMKNVSHEEQLDKVLIVLLDKSGSMSYSMETGTKIAVAWSILQHDLMPNMTGWAYGLLSFGGFNDAHWEVYPCKDTRALMALSNPSAEGGTPMGKALRTTWSWATTHAKSARFILLSDGCPTDLTTFEVLELAKTHKNVPIDTVGIGYAQKTYFAEYDSEFLRELSRITGGIFSEVGTVKQLANTISSLSPTNRPLLGVIKNK